MASGKIKWFDNKRGFGFIAATQGSDVFVHHTQIEGPGYKILRPGEWVTYEVIDSGKGPKAAHVQRLKPHSPRPVAAAQNNALPSTPDKPRPTV